MKDILNLDYLRKVKDMYDGNRSIKKMDRLLDKMRQRDSRGNIKLLKNESKTITIMGSGSP